MTRLTVAGVLLLIVSHSLSADCLTDSQVAELVAGYPKAPVAGLQQIKTLQQAYCSQKRYVEALQKRQGSAVIGYKVGFTSDAGQARFKIISPATGVLLDSMIVPDGGEVALGFGYRTLIEPDFLVTIADDKIMQAKSAREMLSYVSSIHPFIELVAMQLAPEEPVLGNSLVALNIAATKAVVGPAIKVIDSDRFYQQMPDIQTQFTDGSNNIIQATDARALMGHPMEVLFWLVQDFKQRNMQLKAGYLVSLGATGKLYAISDDVQSYHYQFSGLTNEPVTVTVSMVENND